VRKNRTPGTLAPYRFEACTHHQAGSPRRKSGVVCTLFEPGRNHLGGACGQTTAHITTLPSAGLISVPPVAAACEPACPWRLPCGYPPRRIVEMRRGRDRRCARRWRAHSSTARLPQCDDVGRAFFPHVPPQAPGPAPSSVTGELHPVGGPGSHSEECARPPIAAGAVSIASGRPGVVASVAWGLWRSPCRRWAGLDGLHAWMGDIAER